MNFYADFLNEDWSDRPASPRTYLAAYGKHPGWNDHFEMGLETESLILAKKIIYERGIRAEIEAQTWERLPDNERLPDFDHWFLWMRPRESLIGYMSSSRDGKGRSLYPMVMCAHLVDLPLSWAWRVAVPAIESAVQVIRAASTAGRVLTTVSETLDYLRNQHPDTSERDAAGFVASHGLEALGQSLRGDSAKLQLLYEELGEGFAGFAPGAFDYKSENHAPRAQSVRLPAVGQTVADTLNAWTGFLLSELDPGVPLLAIKPTQLPWADFIMGLPVDGDLFRIRAGRDHVPLITEQPPTGSEPVKAILEQKRAELEAQDLPVTSIFNGRTGLRNLSDASGRLEAVRGRGKGMFWRLFGAAKPRPFPVFAEDKPED
ncbi:MAG: hypothetical protein IPP19_10360 [Verrucomicrobia bacterium]|nr:hypothetical protein [Verrucomicrobiota bacterium]